MHELSDSDPLLRRGAGIRHVGRALTVGNLGAVADSVAEAHELFAKTSATLADIKRRIAYLEKYKDEHARWGRRA
jgi:hypothetical protein